MVSGKFYNQDFDRIVPNLSKKTRSFAMRIVTPPVATAGTDQERQFMKFRGQDRM
jgi:hypothetical protein